MQSRVGSGTLEEGKDSATRVTSQYKPLPLKLLQFLLAFVGVGVVFSIISVYTIRYLGLQSFVNVAQPRVESCFQGSYSLESWIRPPLSLWHTMNDTELFWRASFVPQVRDYPFKRTPKIAFMFLTRGPLPMAPLWERFFKGNEGLYSIYVHSLPSYKPDFPPSSVFYRRQIPSQHYDEMASEPVVNLQETVPMMEKEKEFPMLMIRHLWLQVAEWGMMSMCDAERRLLANALLDISNEWFVLLSESCIPLHKFSIVYHYISRSRFSFVGAFDDRGPFGRGRYNPKMSPEVNITNWRKGAQWFEVNRKLAVDIVADDIYYQKFERFCRPSCYVDEHYFPTMLSIQSPHLLANRSITWVDWSRGGAHPATFGKADITEQLFKRIFESGTCIYNNQPSKLCFLFARKFAPSALGPLLEHSSKFFGF